MTIKKQLSTLKDNWVLILAGILVLLFVSGGGSDFGDAVMSKSTFGSFGGADYAIESVADSRGYYPPSSPDFAPDVEERKITRSASITNEVERGTFLEAQSQLKAIVSASDSFILNEDVNKQGYDRNKYYRGYYTIKIDVSKYDSIISQLKEIGEVTSFNENTDDVTGQYQNLEINLETEKARLERYENIYAEAKEVEDKLNINDRIFNQERRIKYLEDAIANIDTRVDYSTVRVNLVEQRSDYASIVLITFAELVETLVDSFNSLLALIFVALPWAVAALIISVVWKFTRRKSGKKRK
jgi:hypothetical protein